MMDGHRARHLSTEDFAHLGAGNLAYIKTAENQNVPVALSVMVFFALCAQCASTLVVIRRETNSWRWPIFCFVYMTVLAYIGALATYQVGSMMG